MGRATQLARLLPILAIGVGCGGNEHRRVEPPTGPAVETQPKGQTGSKEPASKAATRGKVAVDEYSPSGLLFQDGPRPKLNGRITKKTLEDEATTLIRFHRRTGRRCPSKAERQELMVGADSLEALSHYVSLDCEHSKGFTLVLWSKAGMERMLFLGNGCRIITIPGSPIGPFLPAKPAPAVRDRFRDDALNREMLDCMIKPFVTVTVCDGGDTENCTDTHVDDWLATHPGSTP